MKPKLSKFLSASIARSRSASLGGVGLVGIAAMVGVFPGQIYAQADADATEPGALEEILVTAQRRKEPLQEVPIAVAAVTAESLENNGIDTTRDLPQMVPPDLARAINNFNNIERIEVLKGPQGTLFGRNATGGLIQIITREPGDELVASSEVGYANYETISGRAYIGGPISD